MNIPRPKFPEAIKSVDMSSFTRAAVCLSEAAATLSTAAQAMAVAAEAFSEVGFDMAILFQHSSAPPVKSVALASLDSYTQSPILENLYGATPSAEIEDTETHPESSEVVEDNDYYMSGERYSSGAASFLVMGDYNTATQMRTRITYTPF